MMKIEPTGKVDPFENNVPVKGSLIGQRFGCWLVLGDSGLRTKSGQKKWACLCDCGEQRAVAGDSLKGGKSHSCGCQAKPDCLPGEQYGHLTTIKRIAGKDGYGQWECQCDCGRLVVVRGSNLRSGNTRSCGCRKGGPTHGMSHTPEWAAWSGMRARCNNPRNTAYSYYGGRGIKVCPEWDSFEQFYEDVGSRPTVEHSLDRIDPDGDYEPGNVRWATPFEQAKNTVPMRGMTFNHYQARVTETAIYHGQGELLGLTYCLLGLGEEAGEALGKAKKCWRDKYGEMDSEFRRALIAELGDAMWYIAQACTELDVKLDQVARQNLSKIADRAQRGVLKGSGDTR